jgi:alpha-glucosidase
VLWFARSLTTLRKKHPALVMGDMRVLAATDQVFAFERAGGGDHIVCVFNLSKSAASYALDAPAEALSVEVGSVTRGGDVLNLSPRSAWMGKRSQG